MGEVNNGLGYSGFKNPGDGTNELNAQAFFIQSTLAKVRTVALVKIISVTNSGGITPVGFVDMQPLVNQIDNSGNKIPHGILYQCPYFRLQGGSNAIILDPQIGDIGIAVFADRDISTVITNKAYANPGSRRKFDMADGLYLGGVLNGTPAQYVAFSASGIAITSPTHLTINANVQINGTVIVTGGDVVADGISLKTHTHTGITPGGSNTGGPV